jgi:hypothetical protein
MIVIAWELNLQYNYMYMLLSPLLIASSNPAHGDVVRWRSVLLVEETRDKFY